MRGAITAIIFGTILYFFGLWGGACGLAKLWTIRAEQAAYDRGYQDGAKALHQYYLKAARAAQNPEA